VIRVTTTDTETGETSMAELEPGNYAIICADPCRLAEASRSGDGTVVLTLRQVTKPAIREVQPGAVGRVPMAEVSRLGGRAPERMRPSDVARLFGVPERLLRRRGGGR
jgi:hypothetical protein